VQQIYVEATSAEATSAATTEVTEVLLDRHHISDPTQADFQILSQQDVLNSASQTTGVLTLMLGAIAGISLVVGGIGIMNIMLVTVTERTREIGIRKAIGARRRDILMQFLIESMFLAGLGGALGILVGFGLSRILPLAVSSLPTPIISMPSVFMASGCSSVSIPRIERRASAPSRRCAMSESQGGRALIKLPIAALVVVVALLGGFYGGYKIGGGGTASAANATATGAGRTAGNGFTGGRGLAAACPSPNASPSASASGAAARRGATGTVTNLTGSSLTVHDARCNIDVKVTFDQTVIVRKTVVGQASDLQESETITVTGTREADGSIKANSINIVPAGSAGAGGFGAGGANGG